MQVVHVPELQSYESDGLSTSFAPKSVSGNAIEPAQLGAALCRLNSIISMSSDGKGPQAPSRPPQAQPFTKAQSEGVCGAGSQGKTTPSERP